ncbi:MAG: GNAT family N-acetyltransferase [bacterium]|nr:GNAT family N-acetyltransferase [bacterium]
MGKKIRFNKLGGEIEFSYIFESADILSLEIQNKCRRQGIATTLILNMENFLKKNGVSFIFLEVRKNNMPTLKLYQKLNFKIIAIRKGYYSSPKDDAIIMKKNINFI